MNFISVCVHVCVYVYVFVCMCVGVYVYTTVPQVTSSAPEPIMVQMSTNSSVSGMIRPTPAAVATVVAVTTARGTVMLIYIIRTLPFCFR